MATEQSPLARQPDQLDYASPTQFRFGIHQLQKVEFFTVSANLPGITLPAAPYPTPFKDIIQETLCLLIMVSIIPQRKENVNTKMKKNEKKVKIGIWITV